MKNVSSENTSLKVNWQGKIVSIQPPVGFGDIYR